MVQTTQSLPFRPNAIGLSSVKLIGTEQTKEFGTVIHVAGADLMDGTPIFDIKPYIPYGDCHPEALGGFTSTAGDFLLQVDFPQELLDLLPKDKQEAYSMLKKLSGKTHQVMTGVALIKKGKTVMFSEQARVTFASLTDEEINDYIETGEPFDKAGSYAVQGKSAKFVKKIDGDYYSVVGLPCQKLYQVLKNF